MTITEDRQQFWQQHLQRHEASGLSGSRYCRQEQLTYHCFMYWRRKLTGKANTLPEGPDSLTVNPVGFAAVKPLRAPGASGDDALELSLPNGLVVGNIHDGNLDLVRRLLESL